jgi:fimbrial isopeptide formation D2 family protein/LPXTG-motif cell wall-anchored protein
VYPVGATDILEGNGSICSLTSTVPTAEVNIKADYPTITKSSDHDEKTSADVGETIEYTITGKVPDTTGYSTYTYQISDTMTNLTFNSNSVKVKFGDGEGEGTSITATTADDTTANPTLTINGNTFTLTYDMVAYLKDHTNVKAGDTITITYSATVNSSAIDNSITNTASLTYSNDPTKTDSKETNGSTDVNTLYTLNIDVDKYVQDNTSSKLANAKFVLYKMDTDNATKLYYQVDTSTGKVSWVSETETHTTVITGDNGAASFDGIAAGTYYLEETAAPSGYNKLANPITVELSVNTTGTAASLGAKVDNAEISTTAAQGTTTVTDNATMTLKVGVANATGSLLPATGGMGTTIFYVVGGVLVIAAVVLFITKKRLQQMEA